MPQSCQAEFLERIDDLSIRTSRPVRDLLHCQERTLDAAPVPDASNAMQDPHRNPHDLSRDLRTFFVLRATTMLAPARAAPYSTWISENPASVSQARCSPSVY